MIYGHGLNEDQTVRYFLEELTGLAVCNLARQGDSVHQQARLLNQLGFRFQPKVVVHFFFWNDLSDLGKVLSPEEMWAYVRTPLREITYPALPEATGT